MLNQSQERQSRRWVIPAIILVFVFVVHGLVLLDDGLYADGWLLATYQKFGSWDRLYQWFSEAGAPTAFYLHEFIGRLPAGLFLYKLFAFVCIAASALTVYAIGNELGYFSEMDNLFIALLSASYSVYGVWFEPTCLPYLLCYMFFLLGVRLSLQAERRSGAKDRIPSLFLFLGTIISFTISFIINSLIVFYFGFLILLYLYRRRTHTKLTATLKLFGSWRAIIYLSLPFVDWAIFHVLWPMHEIFKATNYNSFYWNPFSLLMHLSALIGNGIWWPFDSSFKELIEYPALGLLLLVLANHSHRKLEPHWATVADNQNSCRQLFLFGAILLVLGVFPYVVVAKSPVFLTIATRHALLIGLPLAMLLVAFSRWAWPADKGEISKSAWMLIISIIVLFSIKTIQECIVAEAQTIKWHSVIQRLSEDTANRGSSLFWGDDQFPTGGTDYPLYFQWTSMFKIAWHDERNLGLDRTVYPPREGTTMSVFWRVHNLEQFNFNGSQAKLVVRRGPRAGDPGALLLHYYFWKLRRPEQINQFLDGVTTVEIRPVAPVPGVSIEQSTLATPDNSIVIRIAPGNRSGVQNARP